MTVLLNPDRPTLATDDLILIALDKFEQLEET